MTRSTLKQYLALVSVSKGLENLKKTISETDVDNLTETKRFWFWAMVEDDLREMAKKIEESRSPTDDEMLEMAKENRPIDLTGRARIIDASANGADGVIMD